MKTRRENLVRLIERMYVYQDDQLRQLTEKKQDLLNNSNNGDPNYDEEHLLAIDQLIGMTRRITEHDISRARSIQSHEEFFDCYQHFHLHYGPELNAMKEWEAKMAKQRRDQENPNEDEDDDDETKRYAKYAQPKKDRYHYCKLAGLSSLADKFGLIPEQFGENLHADYSKNELEQWGVEPRVLAQEYVRPPYFSDVDQVLSTVRYMIALSMAREPSVRAYVRDFYHYNACISVRPRLPRGLAEIDENHACYKFKYLRRKPVRELTEDDYLKLALAEQDELITTTFDVLDISSNDTAATSAATASSQFKPNEKRAGAEDDWDDNDGNNDRSSAPTASTLASGSSKKQSLSTGSSTHRTLADKLKSFYYKDEFSYNVEQWNIQRALIIDEMLTKILYGEFENELRAKLLREAKEHVFAEAQRKLSQVIRVAPYTTSLDGASLDDDEGLRVLSIVYSAGSAADMDSENMDLSVCACINSDGELDEFIWLKSLLLRVNRHVEVDTNPFMAQNRREKQKDMQKLEDFILKKKPKLIVIGAENKDALNIAEDLNELIKSMIDKHGNAALGLANIGVELYDPEIGKMCGEASKFCAQFFTSTCQNVLVKQAITLARAIQDPLLCYSQLFNIDRDVLSLKLHPMQQALVANRNCEDAHELLKRLEIEFVNITNEVGVDLNRCNQQPHTSNVLQFVSGFGMRKAQHVLKLLRQERLALKSKIASLDKQLKTYPVVLNRVSLVTKCQLGRRLFINCAGFIKFDVDSISKEIDEDDDEDEEEEERARRRADDDEANYTEPLDSTRIHPETYEWARKMAIDALDFDDRNNDDDEENERPAATNSTSALKEILENPKRLKDLDLDAFAEELMRTGHGNKITTLYDIRQELSYRYRDKRVPFKSLDPVQRFYLLLKETELTFHVGKLISCKCIGIVRRKPNKEQLDEANPVKDDNTCTWQCSFCKRNDFTELNKVWLHFDNGECPGPAVGVRTLLDNGATGFIGLKSLSDQPVAQPEDRIKLGMVVHARIKNIEPERMRVDLTCRTSDLKDLNGEWRPARDPCFDYNAQEEDERRLNEKRRKEEHKQTYTQRVISHPQFKNVGYAQAIQMLREMKIGDVLFRPSSKGK